MPKIYTPKTTIERDQHDQYEAMMNLLTSIQATLDRIHKTLAEFATVLLNSKFPYGRGHDSFSRRNRYYQ